MLSIAGFVLGTYFLWLSFSTATHFAETNGSKPGGPGTQYGCGCLQLSVFNFEKHKRPYIFTLGRTVIFSTKTQSAFAFFQGSWIIL